MYRQIKVPVYRLSVSALRAAIFRDVSVASPPELPERLQQALAPQVWRPVPALQREPEVVYRSAVLYHQSEHAQS
ncbi:MAG: hypothetical protein ACK58T_09940, partial [Phycisphaerae bacterium]